MEPLGSLARNEALANLIYWFILDYELKAYLNGNFSLGLPIRLLHLIFIYPVGQWGNWIPLQPIFKVCQTRNIYSLLGA